MWASAWIKYEVGTRMVCPPMTLFFIHTMSWVSAPTCAPVRGTHRLRLMTSWLARALSIRWRRWRRGLFAEDDVDADHRHPGLVVAQLAGEDFQCVVLAHQAVLHTAGDVQLRMRIATS
ncbi:MAG TPA: hypothetical protein DIC37_08465 [Pseudomonas sp.]|nr:hypothetical protein [Pseudomonas sp.]